MKVDLREQPISVVQNYLQHAIAPRPICFASTLNKNGEVNLSPFSFFNLFSSNPPVIIFSPARRVRNNTTKHTLENILEVPEVVINIADYDMVQQVSLASCEYPAGVNEFEKAGFTPLESSLVKPPRVKESKINLECRVFEVKHLGDKGGAGNLIFAEVLMMHIDECILDEKQMIDQTKIQHIARLGGNWYCKVDKSNLFEVEKPNVLLGIGIDALPHSIRNSKILTGNHLGKLGNVHEFPKIDPSFEDEALKQIFQYYASNPEDMDKELHCLAAKLLDEGKVSAAWQVLLAVG
ncbi:MAG: flavin reductase family protein [Chitinophagaceae bacterium]|nr:flavin reductase family protein [Bacteroidota bacterium]MCC6258362.1 flavin reductase family protein [Chitinophagaceae bacterium]MCW5917478.1 flavin reductase family protein [Ferruginibacter sp.]